MSALIRAESSMGSLGLVAILISVIGVSLAAHHGLRGWRERRRAAWELDRAAWREWISRP
jgi:hypothetical protein